MAAPYGRTLALTLSTSMWTALRIKIALDFPNLVLRAASTHNNLGDAILRGIVVLAAAAFLAWGWWQYRNIFREYRALSRLGRMRQRRDGSVRDKILHP